VIPIKSLTSDLLINIVTKVTSESYIDYYNMKICCKEFFHASQDMSMWQKVSLEKISLVVWLLTPPSLFGNFTKMCKEDGNIEALFKEGLVEVIRYEGNIEKATET